MINVKKQILFLVTPGFSEAYQRYMLKDVSERAYMTLRTVFEEIEKDKKILLDRIKELEEKFSGDELESKKQELFKLEKTFQIEAYIDTPEKVSGIEMAFLGFLMEEKKAKVVSKSIFE